MSVEQGLNQLRGMIDGTSGTMNCGFCDTIIKNGPVFFKGDINIKPLHYSCYEDIMNFPDLDKVREWYKKTNKEIKDDKRTSIKS